MNLTKDKLPVTKTLSFSYSLGALECYPAKKYTVQYQSAGFFNVKR